MRDNILIDKTIAFAARIIKLHQHLVKDKKEHIISKQIVRSGTSISEEMATSLLNDCLEIERILISSINTAKENSK